MRDRKWHQPMSDINIAKSRKMIRLVLNLEET
jgi:hypothetical protein